MDAVFDASGRFAGVAPSDRLAFGPYMMLADARLNLFSVFDDLVYDRSDADMLSPAMRRHAIEKLKPLGFVQVKGTVLENAAEDVRCYIPKVHALGASPFDIIRYTRRRPRDYVILTPTQTACQIIDGYPLEVAIEKLGTLVQHQPINLFKLVDYLERSTAHKEILGELWKIRSLQKQAVESEPLRRRRALG